MNLKRTSRKRKEKGAGNRMNNIMNNLAQAFNALMYYIVAGVSLVTSNRYLLGISVFLLLFAGKSLKIGKLINAKG